MQFQGAEVAKSVRSRGRGLDEQDLMHMFRVDVTGKAAGPRFYDLAKAHSYM